MASYLRPVQLSQIVEIRTRPYSSARAKVRLAQDKALADMRSHRRHHGTVVTPVQRFGILSASQPWDDGRGQVRERARAAQRQALKDVLRIG